MDVHQRLADDQAKPDEERRRVLATEVLDPPRGVEIGLLEHVVGIDPADQAAIQPDSGHPPEPVPMPREQLGQGTRIAPEDQQQFRIGLSVDLGHSHLRTAWTAPPEGLVAGTRRGKVEIPYFSAARVDYDPVVPFSNAGGEKFTGPLAGQARWLAPSDLARLR